MRRIAIILAFTLAIAAGCTEIPLGPDTTAPTVTLISPTAGTTATDSIVVRVEATDNVGVVVVQLHIEGHTGAIAVDSTPPYELVGYLADVGGGPHSFTVIALDSAGNQASTALTSFTAQITPGLKYIGRITVDGSAQDVVVDGFYAYVAEGDLGVSVIDIRNHDMPLFVGRFDTDGFASGVALAPGRLLVADGAQGVIALSLADPRYPVEQARFVPSGIMAWQLAVNGNYLFVAGGTNGLYVINIGNPDTLVAGAPFNTGGDVRDVVVSGNFVFTAEGTQGVRRINAANPDSLFAVTLYSAIQARDLSLSGGYLYVAAGTEGMYTLSITNPDSLIFGDSYAPGSNMEGIAAAGLYTYIAAGTVGVEVINSTDPTNLLSITNGIFNTTDQAHRLTVDNQYVIVADNADLTILRYIP